MELGEDGDGESVDGGSLVYWEGESPGEPIPSDSPARREPRPPGQTQAARVYYDSGRAVLRYGGGGEIKVVLFKIYLNIKMIPILRVMDHCQSVDWLNKS